MTLSKLRPRVIQNINDPNYFLSPNASGDFNTNSNDQSGYGFYPSAEKNNTYIVYFDSIGGTGPELIDKTGFFVKYLIDEQGNVTEPSPGSIALNNLKNILTPGIDNTAIVESQNATQTLSNLIGEHSIIDIGTIQPLMITETGSYPTNYIPTMSFAQYGSIILAEGVPNFTFLIRQPDNQTPSIVYTDFFVGSDPMVSNTIRYSSIVSDNVRWDGDYGTDENGYRYGAYVFNENTGDYNTDVSFTFKLAVTRYSPMFSPSAIYLQIQYCPTADDPTVAANWQRLPSINISTTNGVAPSSNYGQPIPNDELQTTISTFNTYYLGMRSNPKQFSNGDRVRFRVWIQADVANVVLYGLNSSQWTTITATTNYSGELQTTSSYWDGATWPTDGSPQYLTASIGLSGFINNNMVQITPTASLSMSFSQIIFPANLQPGDNIRFEYDPTKYSKIYDVSTLDDGRTVLKINPAIPTGSKLDHFVVYRIVDDGNYVILDVKKEAVGTMSGFLKPKYISKTLTNNLPNIIDTLKKNGSIPS